MPRPLRRRAKVLIGVAVLLAVCLAPRIYQAVFRPGRIGLRDYPEAGDPRAAVDPAVVSAHNEFAFRLLREVLHEHAGEIVFISPTSVSLALSILSNAAAGSTRDAILETLGVDAFDLGDLNQANADLHASLVKADPYARVAIGNSLWLQEGVSPEQTFLDASRRFYDASVESADLRAASSVEAINDWARQATRGELANVLSSPPGPEAPAVLINAVYFRGVWTTKFDPRGTSDEPFHLADDSQVTVPMMHRHDEIEVAWREAFNAFRLPYGKERLGLCVLVPCDDGTLEEVCELLEVEMWQELVGDFEPAEIDIGLPRASLAAGADLQDPLTRLGMGEAFDPGAADLSNALPPGASVPLWLDGFHHHTMLEIDESGTTAAGVSIGPIGCSKASEIIADRPFLVAICDSETGAIVFLGAVHDPSRPR